MSGRRVALALVVFAVGCASADPPEPVTPPSTSWALSGDDKPIAGETPLTRRITEAGLAFELPDRDWRIDEHRVVAGADAALYEFKHQRDKIAFMVEHVGPGAADARAFAARKRSQLPPHRVVRSLDAGDVAALDAVGYQAVRDEAGVPHTLFVVYALHRELGIVVIMDAPSALFQSAEPGFRAALRSLRYYR